GQADRRLRDRVSEVAGEVEIVFLAVANAKRLLLRRVGYRAGDGHRAEGLGDVNVRLGEVGRDAAAAARIVIIKDAGIDRGRFERLLVAEDQVIFGIAASGDIIVNAGRP